MRKSLGSKRKEMGEDDIATVTRLFGGFVEAQLATVLDADGKEVARTVVNADTPLPTAPEGGKVKLAPLSRIFPNEAFGYRTIIVERPLRDDRGELVLGTKGRQKGKSQPDASLRDTENVPLSEGVETYFRREVLPHAPDAWIDEEKTKIGYEIPFNRHFYVFERPRALAEIDADLLHVTDRIKAMIEGLAA
jgi:type I restriction enzyme M protein